MMKINVFSIWTECSDLIMVACYFPPFVFFTLQAQMLVYKLAARNIKTFNKGPKHTKGHSSNFKFFKTKVFPFLEGIEGARNWILSPRKWCLGAKAGRRKGVQGDIALHSLGKLAKGMLKFYFHLLFSGLNCKTASPHLSPLKSFNQDTKLISITFPAHFNIPRKEITRHLEFML